LTRSQLILESHDLRQLERLVENVGAEQGDFRLRIAGFINFKVSTDTAEVVSARMAS
jgi:hypothetical protein